MLSVSAGKQRLIASIITNDGTRADGYHNSARPAGRQDIGSYKRTRSPRSRISSHFAGSGRTALEIDRETISDDALGYRPYGG
jgi:hypothetical protein